VPRRKKPAPTRDFSQCRRCGYAHLYWAPRSTRETDKPLDLKLAITLDRSGRPEDYDVRASDGFFDAQGWKAEGKRTTAEPTPDGAIFRVAPIHQCDPAAIERWQGRQPTAANGNRRQPMAPALGGQDRAAGEA
jgi:hypothetical protein